MGVVNFLSLDSSVAFRLANKSDEPARRLFLLLGGVTGTGAMIEPGMLTKYVFVSAERVSITAIE
jgi:hypothetical protein